MSAAAADIARVRSFNRLVTRQVGALNDRHLGHRPLGECRVLFEIGTEGARPRDVRARLGLDSGYLSRMFAEMQRDGLVEQSPDPADRRTTNRRLTRAGPRETTRPRAPAARGCAPWTASPTTSRRFLTPRPPPTSARFCSPPMTR